MYAECYLVKSGLCDTTLENLLVVSFLMITVGIGLRTSGLILYIVRSRLSVDNIIFKTDAESTTVYCSGLAFQNTSPCQTQVQV